MVPNFSSLLHLQRLPIIHSKVIELVCNCFRCSLFTIKAKCFKQKIIIPNPTNFSDMIHDSASIPDTEILDILQNSGSNKNTYSYFGSRFCIDILCFKNLKFLNNAPEG